MQSRHRKAKGQIAVIITVGLVALLGATALAIDVGVFYWNWALLQKGTDAGVLAGANFLPEKTDEAIEVAQDYAGRNGILAEEIRSTTISEDRLSITMDSQRTVPYFFARVLGLDTGVVSVTATARVPFAPGKVGGSPTSGADGAGGGEGETAGTFGTSVGQYGLIPIGLDHRTPYSTGQPLELHHGRVGPGNWDALALGWVGGANFRDKLAYGYAGPISIGDTVATEPGVMTGPVRQGFALRFEAAAAYDPSGTFESHKLDNPRVVVVPMVDWEGTQGRDGVPVMGFAQLWVESVTGSTINAYFIDQVVPNSKPDENAPFFGARGIPFLVR